MLADGGPPVGPNYRRQILAAPVLTGLLLLFVLVRAGTDPVMWAVLGVTAAVTLAATAVYFRRALVRVEADLVVQRRLVGERSVDRHRMAQVLFVPQLSYPDPRMSALLYVLDASGQRLLALHGPTWSTEAMSQVAGALGLPVAQPPGPVTAAVLCQHFPRAVPWHIAHPIAVGLIVGLGLAVVVAIGTLVAFHLSR